MRIDKFLIIAIFCTVVGVMAHTNQAHAHDLNGQPHYDNGVLNCGLDPICMDEDRAARNAYNLGVYRQYSAQRDAVYTGRPVIVYGGQRPHHSVDVRIRTKKWGIGGGVAW